jgi:EmrB/QacA subfamily drug resistance transporter
MFMAAMEATVVATAMPTVVADLSGLELYGWVGSIYMLATTVTIPLWGKLSDLRGRKPVMLTGLAVFLLGSVASGTAGSMKALIAFRAIQGVGAGALQPIAMTIVGDIFTVEERAKIQGVFGAVWGVAGMAGPLIGGLIVKALSWRYVFYINVPFGLLSAALLVVFFEEKVLRADKEVSFDAVGALLLVATILAALAAANGSYPIVLAPLGFMTLSLFIRVEKRAKEPILPLRLFDLRVISVASAVSALLGAVMMGSLLYAPLFVQAVRGGSPTDGGSSVAPMLVGWPIASAASARLLVRIGFRPLVRVGLLALVAATIGLAWCVGGASSLGVFRCVVFAMGIGMGLVATSMLIAVQETVDWQDRGVATSSTMFFRTIGGAVVVGALGGLLARGVGGAVSESDLAKMIGPNRTVGLSPERLASYAGVMKDAMMPLFWVVAACALVALGIGMAFPALHVKERSEKPSPLQPRAPTAPAPAPQALD